MDEMANDLHIAAAMGDEVSVTRILNAHPELAEELDLQKSSPLHIAAAIGHLNITTSLLLQAPNMCWSRDINGMNPVHVAAVKGHVDVLVMLVKAKPFAALEKLDRGETALHLCVKHGHLEALRALVENLGKLNGVEDNNGETLLHWAVRYQFDVEMIKYLMNVDEINEKSRNSKGQSALDLLKQSPWYIQDNTRAIALEIEKHLKSRSKFKSFIHKLGEPPEKHLRSKSASIMVVAVLIATMAFQATVSPPGGVWQDNTPHKAGESVIAFTHPKIFKVFMRSGSLAFLTSLATILLLISGLPSRYRIFMWTLTVIMFASITAIAITYTTSQIVVTPRRQRPSRSHIIDTGIVVSSCVIGILFILNSVRMWNFLTQKLRVWLNRPPTASLTSMWNFLAQKLRVWLNRPPTASLTTTSPHPTPTSPNPAQV